MYDVLRMTQEGYARLADAIESEWGEGDPYTGPNAYADPVAYRRARVALRSTPVGPITLTRDLSDVDESNLTHSEIVALLVEFFGLRVYF